MSAVCGLIICMTDAERPFVEEAINSVLSQTAKCSCMVALREGSTAFDELAARYPTVEFVRLPLMPAGFVRNELVQRCTAQWVAFLDGDDVWESDKIQRQLELARRAGLDFVGTDHTLISEGGTVCAYNLSINVAMPSSWLVRRETMAARPFNNDPVVADVDWWIVNSPTIRTGRLPVPLLRYRVRESSLSSMMGNKRNKLTIVRLASRPMFRPLVLAATWLLNRARRQSSYVWNTRDWGAEPGQDT